MTAPRRDLNLPDGPFYRSKTLLTSEIAQPKHVRFDNTIENSTAQRSHASLPWRANTYYGASTNHPSVPNAHSMPAPRHEQHLLRNTDAHKVPPVFSAARTNLYTRYNPGDWNTANDLHWVSGDMARGSSEAVRRHTVNLCKELDERTKRNQQESGNKIGSRIGDITQWKAQLRSEMDDTTSEIRALDKDKEDMEKVLKALNEPLRIAEECLYAREKRRGIDLVHDDVERQLIREIDVLKDNQNKINHFIGDATSQMALNRAALHELQRDCDDKEVASKLENSCHHLNDANRTIKHYNGIHRIDNSASVPMTWAQYSENNVKRARAERTASLALRKRAVVLAEDCSNDTNNHWNAVNAALNDRLGDYTDAKNRLQLNLLQTLQEISEQERTMALLRKSLEEKCAPMQVAQTRLATRTRRPDVEACRDTAHHRLIGEVHQIGDSVDQLRVQMSHAEHALQNLLKVKLSLEHDLDIKNNSILIDRQRCLDLRFNPVPHKTV